MDDDASLWMGRWRFDMLFLTLSKLGFVGTLVVFIDARDLSAAPWIYNFVFMETYTIFFTTCAKKGFVRDSSLTNALIVIHTLMLVLSVYPVVLLASMSCWSIDECSSDSGQRIIDLLIFIGAGTVSLLCLMSLLSSVHLLLYKQTIKAD